MPGDTARLCADRFPELFHVRDSSEFFATLVSFVRKSECFIACTFLVSWPPLCLAYPKM